jgi:hypothetical protein
MGSGVPGTSAQVAGTRVECADPWLSSPTGRRPGVRKAQHEGWRPGSAGRERGLSSATAVGCTQHWGSKDAGHTPGQWLLCHHAHTNPPTRMTSTGTVAQPSSRQLTKGRKVSHTTRNLGRWGRTCQHVSGHWHCQQGALWCAVCLLEALPWDAWRQARIPLVAPLTAACGGCTTAAAASRPASGSSPAPPAAA